MQNSAQSNALAHIIHVHIKLVFIPLSFYKATKSCNIVHKILVIDFINPKIETQYTTPLL